MKHLYLVIFFLFCAVGFGQSPKNQGDIDGFSMYPNPVTNGKVYITTANNSPKEIFIYDVFGTLILKTTILGKELSLNDMDAGVYVLRVFEKDKMATRKLIVK
ncbi:T9SS C-terminal target domain-containing protein [Maribacter algicola]|uniref:T9SS C-terminal target domain-containing protein n=1 Tax=Maribacter algicola TaxID=2498892 RepID=A0A426RN17_9FLAO|nr:T9SS type A sorting domain-containing protein [Maribacter algicola]RRQ50376.1 T9SS C-terminal target domain-containing protein [Maribacter algicola]